MHRRIAAITVICLTTIGVAASPFATVKLLAVPGYMTAFGSAMIVINLLLAALLFSKGAIESRGDATRLGTAYLFVAVIFVPLVACFPGGIMPGSVIGTPMSAVWLWSFWHIGFALCIIRYAWIAKRPGKKAASVGVALIGVVAAVAVLTVLATRLVNFLPALLSEDGRSLFGGASGLVPLATLAILFVSIDMLRRLDGGTPEQLWLLAAMVAAVFDVWLTYIGSSRFSLGWYLSKCGSLFTSLVVLISLLHEVFLLYSRAAVANAVLEDLAHRDGLTGLSNRRHLDELLAVEWRRSVREQQVLSMLMIDVDHFKNYNDQYGHPQGDHCLREVAAMIGAAARRPTDKAARYGGEEFVLLLPATDEAGAAEMAQRIIASVQGLGMKHAASPLGRVTLSVGLATAIPQPGIGVETLVLAADRGLYRAKNLGRNQACTEAEGPSLPDQEQLQAILRMHPEAFLATAAAE